MMSSNEFWNSVDGTLNSTWVFTLARSIALYGMGDEVFVVLLVVMITAGGVDVVVKSIDWQRLSGFVLGFLACVSVLVSLPGFFVMVLLDMHNTVGFSASSSGGNINDPRVA